MNGKRRWSFTFVAGGLAMTMCLVAPLRAQEARTLQALQRLHEEICKPEQVLAAEAGAAALEKLRAWNLSPGALPEKERGWLLQSQVYASLAVGQAAQAAEKLAELQALAPEARSTLQAAYLVAAASGDARTGQELLNRLAETAAPDERRTITPRRRWLRHVGKEAPAVEIGTADGAKLAARDRYGIVLVIDFWNSRAVSQDYAQAMRKLYDAYRSEMGVQFVGVNTDGRANADAAQRFIAEAGYTWPQHFEERVSDAPITHKAFQAGAPPWTVVVDGAGRVRAVGAVTEPAVQYALRAAVADAAEKLASGKAAEPPGGRTAAAGAPPTGQSGAGPQRGGQAGPAPPPPGKGDLPSNEEAEALLRQARTFLKTGMKTKAKELLLEIVQKYPGTRQAKEAQERLDLLK